MTIEDPVKLPFELRDQLFCSQSLLSVHLQTRNTLAGGI